MAHDIRLWHPVVLAISFFSTAHAFYIPGYSIRSYRENDAIPLLVNKIFSDRSQLQYAYFDLPFVCPPSGKKHGSFPFASGHSMSLNLGEILRGDRIQTSDFEVSMGKNIGCQFLCYKKIGRKDVYRAKNLISEGYVVEWILDNLPGATSFVSVDRSKRYYSTGFKLGYQDFSPSVRQPRFFIHNHFTLVIRWRDAPGNAGPHGGKVIVGFEIYPKSIGGVGRSANGCPKDVHAKQERLELYIAPNNTRLAEKYPGSSYLPENDDVDDGASITVPYSYSVYFRKEENIGWSNRWDLYFSSHQEGRITHWLAILNALTIATVLGFVVFVIWGRTMSDGKGRGEGYIEEGKVKLVSRTPRSGSRTPRTPKSDKTPSISLLDHHTEDRYDDHLSDEEMEEVAPWKHLHGDVFRTPAYSGLLAPIVGSGMQLLFMAVGLLALSCLGVLNPSFRGGFLSVGMGLFVFAGTFSGYFSGRLYRTFGGKNWHKNTIVTALLCPGLFFTLIFVLNLFVWAQASSTAIPFGTLIAIIALWLLIQLPLVYFSGWYGYEKTTPWDHPTRTSSISRQIPPQSWYLTSIQGTLLTGLPPFAVLFVELLFVFHNLLQDKSGYYYVFGYLSAICIILIITVSEVTIIATYSQLCAENHRWWWQSFIIGGSSALWVFISFLGCAVYGLLTGTVGFLTAYAFVRRIYSSVKTD
ncbi:hypothetical protein LOZ61_002473 [Ophidiomyces ophidiicola]|uniref:Uncharacterized protein n=1 Tax=Ophidiomyces ophidiicola TaxID=1387563 RepID=A0ACB8V4E9_9EURO|nr:hypothetical protein LOZ64_004622 [Ophidiomyces ophidiicola]KAI1914054.1 hypothetical protein LOZ61_002473 [Ophidiomyces ophidiicola]KAI1943410.1 hypothetical protein LOZ62_004316 [Ophidiomyces ophidiicola]KAI1968434.1 hypothetical protein LOZ59_000289 [Ophidiomyces ophidiicola]KAI1970257.1 hypothetical protein LOZ56_003819 [Ophidiomyces ophidiicola]